MIEYIIVALIAGIAIGWIICRALNRSPTSMKEQLLKAMAKSSKALAALSDPGADEQAAIAARLKREELLQAEIAANMLKITKP